MDEEDLNQTVLRQSRVFVLDGDEGEDEDDRAEERRPESLPVTRPLVLLKSASFHVRSDAIVESKVSLHGQECVEVDPF